MMALVLVAGLAWADTINTYPDWNQTSSVSAFGAGITATYGQVFTVPTGATTLSSFSFWLESYTQESVPDPSPVDFNGYVAAWDGLNEHATGPVLAFGPQVLPGGTTPFGEFTFYTGSLGLTAGQQYVAFLNDSSTYYQSGQGNASMGVILSNGAHGKTGGYFVFYNNSNDFSLLTTSRWDSTSSWGTGADAAFLADFGTGTGTGSGGTPEPGSFVLLGASLGMFGLLRRRIVKR